MEKHLNSWVITQKIPFNICSASCGCWKLFDMISKSLQINIFKGDFLTRLKHAWLLFVSTGCRAVFTVCKCLNTLRWMRVINYIVYTKLLPAVWSAVLFAWQVIFYFSSLFFFSDMPTIHQSLYILCTESPLLMSFESGCCFWLLFTSPRLVFLFLWEVLGCGPIILVFIKMWW